MSNKRASTKDQNEQITWGKILADAEEAERSHRKRLRAIKKSILAIRAKISAGESLPDYLK